MFAFQIACGYPEMLRSLGYCKGRNSAWSVLKNEVIKVKQELPVGTESCLNLGLPPTPVLSEGIFERVGEMQVAK